MIKVKNGKAISNLSNKSRKANKTRNFVAIIAIALTTLLFSSLFTMGLGTVENLQRATMRQAGGDGHAVLKYITQEQFDAVKDNKSIKEIAFDMPLCDEVSNPELLKRHAEFWYYDEVGLKLGFIQLNEGKMPVAEDEVIADSKTLKLLGVPLEIGAEVPLELIIHGESVSRTFKLSGWWESDPVFNVGQIFASRAYVDAHSGELQNTYYEDFSMTGAINAYIMFKNSFDLQGKLITLLEDSGFSAIEGDPNYIENNVNWSYLSTNFGLDPETIIGLGSGLILITLTGYLIIYNIFQISVVKDIRFYGLLKTIGTTSKQIRRIIRRQALVLSAIGIPIGMVLGFFCGTALVPVLISNTDYGESAISVAPNPFIFIGAAIFALITVFISTLKPAHLAGRVSPIEAVRYTDSDGKAPRKLKKSTGGAKMHRFAMSNLGRNKKRTALVVISLSLCIMLMDTVVTLSGSIDMDKFLSKFNDSDFLIAHAEYFNNAFTGPDNQLSEDMISAAEGLDGFEEGGRIYGGRMFFATDPRYTGEYNRSEYGDVFASVYGLEDYPMESLKLLDGEIDMEKLLSGDYILEGVHLNDNGKPYLDRIKYNVGDKVTLHNYYGDGDEYSDCEYRSHEFTVLGHVEIHTYANTDRCYSDYTFFLPAKAYMPLVSSPAVMNYAFNVTDDKEESTETFLKDYCDTAEPLMNYTSKATSRESFADMQNTVLMVGGALGIIIGIIGILNFINAVLTGIISRRKEFAMLQSIGMTRAQLKKMLCYEGLYYAVLSGGFSLVFGLLLSAVVVQAICKAMWFMSYHMVVWPLLAAVPVLLLLGFIIPLIIYSASDKESIVERLREAE